MTSKSHILTIGTETSVTLDQVTISKNRKAFFDSEFEKRMQKILLNGEKPLAKEPDDKLMQRFAANELNGMKKHGQHDYEFGACKNGWLIDVLTFEPKGIRRRLHNKISKEHWVTDNVARFSKDSRDFIVQTVSNASHEEDMEIYQYLCYLNSINK